MTFAARMQHLIYWGPLKKPIEWSLKTVLAPWAYIASVIYHDSLWYPLRGRRAMQRVLDSAWGRLFQNWERATPDDQGYPEVGGEPARVIRTGLRAFVRSLGVLRRPSKNRRSWPAARGASPPGPERARVP